MLILLLSLLDNKTDLAPKSCFRVFSRLRDEVDDKESSRVHYAELKRKTKTEEKVEKHEKKYKMLHKLKINTINQLSQEIYERHSHSHTIKAQIGGFTKNIQSGMKFIEVQHE